VDSKTREVAVSTIPQLHTPTQPTSTASIALNINFVMGRPSLACVWKDFDVDCPFCARAADDPSFALDLASRGGLILAA